MITRYLDPWGGSLGSLFLGCGEGGFGGFEFRSSVLGSVGGGGVSVWCLECRISVSKV